jgi:hypothetical protein
MQDDKQSITNINETERKEQLAIILDTLPVFLLISSMCLWGDLEAVSQ